MLFTKPLPGKWLHLGASIHAYTSVVGKEDNLQRGTQFSVSSPGLLHKEKVKFVLNAQDCCSIKVQKTSNKDKKAEVRCPGPLVPVTRLLLALGRTDCEFSPEGSREGMVLWDCASEALTAARAPQQSWLLPAQGGEVLTEIGWESFSFKIPNLIMHNLLASPPPILLGDFLLGNAAAFQGWLSPHSFSSPLVRLYFAGSKGPLLSRLLSM